MRLIPAGAACLLAGCISVKAPEKPIEINLNVNIRQEVVVSLRRDVQDLDKQFPGVF
nr:YnbE family lipoprotein [Sphingomonas jatrophae]